MSWSELERFVSEVEADPALQRALKHCRSRKELILAARRLGYRITRVDISRAWELHCRDLDCRDLEERQRSPQPEECRG